MAASFEDGPALRQSLMVNAVLIDSAAWVAYSYSTGADAYTNHLHQTLGLTRSGEYDVASAPYVYPAYVAIGEAGVLGTMNRYGDGEKSAFLGRIVSTYRVLADTAPGAAVFQQTDLSFDVYNNQTRSVEMRYRLDASGGMTMTGVSVVDGTSTLSATAD